MDWRARAFLEGVQQVVVGGTQRRVMIHFLAAHFKQLITLSKQKSKQSHELNGSYLMYFSSHN